MKKCRSGEITNRFCWHRVSFWKFGAPDDVFGFGIPRPWKKSFDWRKLHGALVIHARCLHQRPFLQYIARRGMGRGAWEGFKQRCGCQQKWYETWNKTGWYRKNMFLFAKFSLKATPILKEYDKESDLVERKLDLKLFYFSGERYRNQERFQCLSDPGLLGG